MLDRDRLADDDAGMVPRDRRGLNLDDVVAAAPDDVLAGVERDARGPADQPRGGALGWLGGCGSGRGDRAAEAIADAVHRPDPRLGCAVVDGPADLVDQRLHAGLGDERLGPDARVDLGLRHRVGPLLEQEQQQLPRLAREAHLTRGAEDAAGVGVDADGAERIGHGRAGSGGARRL